jgi:hypothetical protein
MSRISAIDAESRLESTRDALLRLQPTALANPLIDLNMDSATPFAVICSLKGPTSLRFFCRRLLRYHTYSALSSKIVAIVDEIF